MIQRTKHIAGFLLTLLLVCRLPAQEISTPAADPGAGVAAEANTAGGPDSEPSQMSLLDDDWELKVGDRLVYQVLEEREEPQLLVVNGHGQLLVPLIGLVETEGRTAKALAYAIQAKLEQDFFNRATVVISQREADRNSGRVTVIGEVNKQGEQLIPADAPLTLSQAILRGGGGFSLYADKTQVSVVSAGSEEARITVDLAQMLSSGDLTQDPVLRAGDVVIVGRADREAQVYVLGAVQAPGLYSTIGRKYTLSEVIMMARGFTRFAKKNRVRLVTTDANGERTEVEVDVGRILDGDRSHDPIVKPGDMVIVEEKMVSFGG